jgi:DNA topoisomerase-3
MKVIIAEKPSLARNIVAAIGNMKQQQGYYINDEYIVTYVFGHLFTLADIEDYPGYEGDGKWSMKNIPCYPDTFKFNLKKDATKQVDKGIEKQFNIIKSLINRDDVDNIINAGDADREGEVIVRLIIINALEDKNKLKTRLWLPDQTPETIKEGLSDLKEDKEYDNLANEGFARTYIDWLYGVNLTRYATLKTGTLLRVGRVIVPIVKAIYDRDMAIRNFVSEIYYGITSNEITNGEYVELNSKEKFDKNEQNKALELCKKYNEADAIVTDKKQKKDSMNPPKLFSLTKLQNYLGKKYKMSMEKSLAITQGLYEKGFLTYPRTNSEYLAVAEKDKIKKIINNIKEIGYPVKFIDKKTIFDDSKIESHSALTPTYKIPDPKNLSEEERIVYQTVFKRFVAVFCANECIVQKTEIKIMVGDYEEFNLKGMMILEPGWTKYEEPNSKDKILPNLNIGDKVNHIFKPKEKETTPPKHYTIETLNNYLKNPFKEDKKKLEEDTNEEIDDVEEYKAIFEGLELGTEATRTGIIDNARKSKYIELKKDVYYILPDGEYLIESLIHMGISMDKYKTSELGKALKKVFHDEITVDDSVKLAEKEISEVFDKKDETPFFGDVVGTCPYCGKNMKITKYSYACEDYKECKFNINYYICKKYITKDIFDKLIKDGKTDLINGFTSKQGKEFSAMLTLENKKINFLFK